MKRLFFFATPVDIKPVLSAYESYAEIKFVEMGYTSYPDRAIYLNSSEIPDVGLSTHETGSASKDYLVSYRDTKNIVREFVDETGVPGWRLSNADNEDTIILTTAGLWKGSVLLPGNVQTLHSTLVAQQLMKWYLKALRSESFILVDTFWVGREALEMLKAGKRLAMNAVQSPPKYDLKFQ